LHHEVQKFSFGTGSPGGPGKRAVKWLWCGGGDQLIFRLYFFQLYTAQLRAFSALTLSVGRH